MNKELELAIDEARETYNHYCHEDYFNHAEVVRDYEHAIDLAIKEIEEKDELDKERIKEVDVWKKKLFKLKDRILALETAMREAIAIYDKIGLHTYSMVQILQTALDKIGGVR